MEAKNDRTSAEPRAPVLAGQAQPAVGGARAFQDALMRQDHPFGRAGRARSEPQEGGVLDPGRQRRLRRGQAREAQRDAAGHFQFAD